MEKTQFGGEVRKAQGKPGRESRGQVEMKGPVPAGFEREVLVPAQDQEWVLRPGL